jgi:hypothetical protein
MFERARLLWRRLTGQTATLEPGRDGTSQDDRRVWARFEANHEILCHPSGGSAEEALKARVCNISRGGIKLLVPRSFEPGELLTVHLPGGQDGQTPLAMLACVVHAQATNEGDWALGCSFAEELSDADLQTFGASRTRTTPPDVRIWARYPCSFPATYQVVREQTSEPRPATVVNISPRGVALQTDDTLEPGTLLSAELHGRSGQPLTILACVVHASRSSDEHGLVGCSFIRELTENDLCSLL